MIDDWKSVLFNQKSSIIDNQSTWVFLNQQSPIINQQSMGCYF